MNILNLFKYYAPEYEGEDDLSFYSRKSIFFQKPEKFNDPWDCKAPQITVPRQINSLKEIWCALAKRAGSLYTEAEWQKIKNLPRSEIKKQFEKIFKTAFDEQRSRIGVFSLSSIPDSQLMWSHYARSHSGYVLHFQINLAEYYTNPNLKSVGVPIPVIYKTEREIWNLRDYYNNREKYVYNMMRFKSDVWAYECEVRLLNVNASGFIKTPSNWLKSIIIGLDTNSGLRKKLHDIGDKLDVPVLSAVMNKTNYKIDIPGLAFDGGKGESCFKQLITSKVFEL